MSHNPFWLRSVDRPPVRGLREVYEVEYLPTDRSTGGDCEWVVGAECDEPRLFIQHNATVHSLVRDSGLGWDSMLMPTQWNQCQGHCFFLGFLEKLLRNVN